MKVFMILKRFCRKVVVRHTTPRTINDDLAHGVPRFFMSRHEGKPIKICSDDTLRFFGTVIPKFQVSTEFLVPIRSHIVEKIQDSVHLPVLVMRVIQMRIKKIILCHKADPAGIKVFVGDHLVNAGYLFYHLQDPRILKRKDDLLENCGILVHLCRNILVFSKALLKHHCVFVGKGLKDFKNLLFRQQMIDYTTLNSMLSELVTEPLEFIAKSFFNNCCILATIHILTPDVTYVCTL